MKIEFIGPPFIAADGGIQYEAKLNGHSITCYFSYELLEDLDPYDVLDNAMDHFKKHQLKLLSIAEQKILDGHLHNNHIYVFTNDLTFD